MRILIVGDSVFEGKKEPNVGFYLEKIMFNDHILNRAVAGSDLVEIKERLVQDITDHNPDYVVLQGGVNDIAENVNTQDITQRYQDLINETLNAGIPASKIIVTTISPWLSQDGEVDYLTTASVNDWIRQQSSHLQLETYMLLEDGNGQLLPEYSVDGTHINGNGAKEVAIEIQNVINFDNGDTNHYKRYDPTTIVTDDFNRQDDWLGDKWSDIRHDIEPVNGVAKSRYGSDISTSILNQKFYGNVFVSCLIKPNAISSFGAIVFTDGNWRNINQFSYSGNGNKFEVVEIKNNRVRRQIEKIYDMQEDEYLMSVRLDGHNYTYYINGQQIGSCFITTQLPFKIGIMVARLCEIRNFVAVQD